MQTLDPEFLALVTGAGFWRERYYDLTEGMAIFGIAMRVDEFHPPTPATYARYDALRKMHGRPPRPSAQQ